MTGKLILLNVATVAAILVHGTESAYGQIPEIGIDNGFGYPLYIWIWPRQQPELRKGWVKPVPYLARSGSLKLRLDTPGDYFLVARDTAGNDDPLGWVNMHEVFRRAPEARFRIEGKYVTRTVQRDCTVTKLVPNEYTCIGHVWCNGRWFEVEHTYTRLVPVNETRTQTLQVRRPEVDLRVNYHGQVLSLEDFFRLTDNGP